MFIYRNFAIALATFAVVVSCQPNLYWLKNSEKNSGYCVITNETESTALTLLKNNRPIDHSYLTLPHEAELKLSCEGNCKNKFGNVWKYDRSENYELPPILDRRWEGLTTVVTELKTGLRYFKNVYNFTDSEKDFTITISVKIKFDAHIFLCDGVSPLDSRCYWFIIGGWGGKNSIVRECQKNEIPREEDKYPLGTTNCGIRPNNADIPRKFNHAASPTNLQNWTEFQLIKKDKQISIKFKANDTNIVTFNSTNSSEILVKHLVLASLQKYPGRWKINDDPNEYITGIRKIESWSNESQSHSFSIFPTSKAIIYLCKNEGIVDTSCKKIELSPTADNNNYKISALLWTHFTLEKTGDGYKIYDVNNVTNSLKFSYVANHIYLTSGNETFWKIHLYDLFTSITTNSTSSLDLIKGKRGQRNCIAVFAYTNNSNLTFQLEDDQSNILARRSIDKVTTWQEIKLSTILKEDTNVKLKIRLNVETNGRAFISDIKDCSRNFRILKTDYANKTETISCQALKFPDVKPTEKISDEILTVPYGNESIIDTLWLMSKGSCNRVKGDFEKVLDCSIGESNIEGHFREICFATFEKHTSNGRNTCKVYVVEVSTPYYFIWIFIVVFLVCCTVAMFYWYKKNKISDSTLCTNIISRLCAPRSSALVASYKTKDENCFVDWDDSKFSNYSFPVEVEAFKAYVETALHKGYFLVQYNMVKDVEPPPSTVGSMKEHIRKNRYKNIIANDDTRVKLESTYSNLNDDYINANYIKGYYREKAYIATQAPTPITLMDFWRMIWNEDVRCIVMLCKLIEEARKKCQQYWPELNDTMECCGFKISCVSLKSVEDGITLRTLKVLSSSVEREVIQIHYEDWSDHSVPKSPATLSKLLNIIGDFENDDKPIVVHCSAGVGRTGTFILCDIAIKMAKATRKVDVLSILHELRQQRTMMVQTLDQYVYAHEVIADVLESL